MDSEQELQTTQPDGSSARTSVRWYNSLPGIAVALAVLSLLLLAGELMSIETERHCGSYSYLEQQGPPLAGAAIAVGLLGGIAGAACLMRREKYVVLGVVAGVVALGAAALAVAVLMTNDIDGILNLIC